MITILTQEKEGKKKKPLYYKDILYLYYTQISTFIIIYTNNIITKSNVHNQY